MIGNNNVTHKQLPGMRTKILLNSPAAVPASHVVPASQARVAVQLELPTELAPDATKDSACNT
jgi:hypothetical protein